MKILKNFSSLNYKLAIVPKNIFETIILLFKGFRIKGEIGFARTITYYSKDKYYVKPEPMPFEINEKVRYLGDDKYLLREQLLRGYLIISGFYNRSWLNVSCSPMSYKVKDFELL